MGGIGDRLKQSDLLHTAYNAPMQSLETLWAKTRDILALMHMALGDPQVAVRPCETLASPSKRELRAWLAPLEALVRKLLLIEAQTLSTAGFHRHNLFSARNRTQMETKSRRSARRSSASQARASSSQHSAHR